MSDLAKTSTRFKKNGCMEKLRVKTIEATQQWVSQQLRTMKEKTCKEQESLDRILNASGFYGVLGFQKVQHLVVPQNGKHLFLRNVSFEYKIAIEVACSEETTMRHKELLDSMGFELVYINKSEANAGKVLQSFVLGVMKHLRDVEQVKVRQRRKTLESHANKQEQAASTMFVNTKKLTHLDSQIDAMKKNIGQQGKKGNIFKKRAVWKNQERNSGSKVK